MMRYFVLDSNDVQGVVLVADGAVVDTGVFARFIVGNDVGNPVGVIVVSDVGEPVVVGGIVEAIDGAVVPKNGREGKNQEVV